MPFLFVEPAAKFPLKSVQSFVHNRLVAGSPGSGKTLLARALLGILPGMSIEESLEVTRIYSVADVSGGDKCHTSIHALSS